MNQNPIEPAVSVETLTDVPEHVLKGLPEEVSLLPSAVDKTRLGVWATKPILRGRKFGPFVGDKKKRSQVKSNVYMWEVYYPNLGWMCVDATDPEKGNWLRYVNWARSGKEQNLFPLEINRTIYYKTLKPIEPGEELLVWYNGEDNPAIAAAIEEERASHHRGKRNSPKAKKGKKKFQEVKNKGKKTKNKKQSAALDLAPADMREAREGHKQEDEIPSVSAVLSLEQTAVIQEMVNQDTLPNLVMTTSAIEPNIIPDDKSGTIIGVSEVFKEQEQESEGEDSEDDIREEEEEEEPDEEEDDVGLPKEYPGMEPIAICNDGAESVEEQSSISEDTPESSPKKKYLAKFPKERGETNGSVQGTFMFPCQHCERKFTTKQGLERHMHIHISAVSHAFKCRYCGKAFGTQINRRRHERRHEAGPKRRPFLMLSSTQPSEGGAKNQTVAEDSVKEEPSTRQGLTAMETEKVPIETPNPALHEESKEPKETHPCKYCRKVFGTHTNMRRHQRRVHERHLIPRGVKRKPEEPHLPTEPTQHVPNVYVASTDLEEEGETEDVYIMDVSSNISENLSYYIDGKIQSNSSTSNCDVIEVESGSAELYGINCLLSPVAVEIASNLKTTPVHLTEVSKELPGNNENAESKKRRTASPPLLSKIKTEIDPEPITSLCSLTIPLTISAADSLPLPKEKNIYLSSKLKQLLQTQQEGNKVTPSSPPSSTDIPKLGNPAPSSPLLPTASSRFKRRTSSPPSSPQHSPALRDVGRASEGKSAWNDAGLGSKIPKLESRNDSPAWSLSGIEEKESGSPLCLEEYKVSKDWIPSPPFGNVCNQQPLDLSSNVKQRSNNKDKGQGSWESVLDLSVHKKPCSDAEAKESSNLAAPACNSVKKKPTTSMLQKVLLNEYNGMDSASDNPGSETDPSLSTCKLAKMHVKPEGEAGIPLQVVNTGFLDPPTEKPLPSVSSCQVPPLLTPTQSSSPPPCLSVLKVPTPPPLLLPTVPSPLPEEPISVTPSSCPSPLSNATAHSPLPVLSPTASALLVFPTEPLGCPSPGPPNLSSSSSSSFSSSSSSSSSSSPSPPPLSVVSSVLSFGDNLENSVPLLSFKQEETDNRHQKAREDLHVSNEEAIIQDTFNKNFVCNVCESPFLSIKDLSKHLTVHAEEWPFKCEFCVQLFREKTDLSEHRFLLHGVGNIFVCSLCKKEFAFLCNLQQHQRDLHPDKECTHHEFESGTLRPQNFTDPMKAQTESLPEESSEPSKEEEDDAELNDSSEELYTTIKIMASGVKSKNPDVRMGLNQHYPSFKPPPFQYHHRNPNGIGVTATNFTTHNIPQTFTTAIRCTKCGKGVDNMPELHKHILACASASDKKRYTPKKNPVPLKQTVRPKNGVVLPTPASSTFRRMGQPKRLNFSVEAGRMSSNKLKNSALKKKNQLIQKAILQKKKSQQKAELKNKAVESSSHICPYCNREFTYIRSLNKHASYSCPKKPISPSSKKSAKKKTGTSSAGRHKSASQRRRTADAEIKMQSAQAHLGKTRARSSGPLPLQLPSTSFKLKQNIKFVPSAKFKKPSPPPASKTNSPVRVAKTVTTEGKKAKGLPKNSSSELSSKTSCKLHVRIQKNKVAFARKPTVANKKPDRFRMKTRERVGGPVTRSLQQATSADVAEKKEEIGTKQELKDFRNLL